MAARHVITARRGRRRGLCHWRIGGEDFACRVLELESSTHRQVREYRNGARLFCLGAAVIAVGAHAQLPFVSFGPDRSSQLLWQLPCDETAEQVAELPKRKGDGCLHGASPSEGWASPQWRGLGFETPPLTFLLRSHTPPTSLIRMG